MDMLFSAALKGKRRDLLNHDCPFLPEDFGSVDFTPPLQMPCILSELCLKYGGELEGDKDLTDHSGDRLAKSVGDAVVFVSLAAIEKECRVIRDYYWRSPVKRLFEMEVRYLMGNPPDIGESPLTVAV